jgi:cyclopropane fatty-acyl-phospholipid synthase-like methyltransferase
VRAHCARMQLRRGESVFEAGSAAGAFVDSLSRQYGVRVAGVDLAPSLVKVARRRVFRGAGRPEFCAASAHILKSAFFSVLT